MARVRCARIATIAGLGTSTRARAVTTYIAYGAGIPVITGKPMVEELTSQLPIAAVRGAGIPIIAALDAAPLTTPILAVVIDGTGISITASIGIRLIYAPIRRRTAVIGTGISVPTIELSTGLAAPPHTLVGQGAYTSVTAGKAIVNRNTPLSRVAGIRGAGVSIITIQERA